MNSPFSKHSITDISIGAEHLDFIYSSFVQTIIAIVIVILIDVALEYLVFTRVSTKRKKRRYKVYIRNILFWSLLVFLAKIWINGFSHLLAFIGFISAALTITQKENLLNLTGGLIIMWRDTFAEGDYVSINHFTGIVENIGIFYFTLQEIKFDRYACRTGKVIKVPNSYISLHPFEVYNYDNLVIYDRDITFKFSSNIDKILDFSQELQTKLLNYVKTLEASYTNDEKKESQKLSLKKVSLLPLTEVSIQQSHPVGYVLNIRMHCSIRDEMKVNKFIDDNVMNFISASDVNLTEE
tara:strand:- start:108350 stop:109237 length:888 start_codon:yes stop_codon:yes gene_type:complete